MDKSDMFYYDQDEFSSLDKNNKHKFIKNFINTLVSTLNNPSLIDVKEAPNGNLIYHLYSDGTITRQKGGWAYGKRSVFDIKGKCVSPNTYFRFPIESVVSEDTYAIMTKETCEKIRDIIDELLLQV
jgi:hypothetical protein